MEDKITINKCCAICQHLDEPVEPSKEVCPLSKVIISAREMDDYSFDNVAMYQVSCDKFELNKFISGSKPRSKQDGFQVPKNFESQNSNNDLGGADSSVL